MFTILLSSLPILVITITDLTVPKEEIYKNPEIYTRLRRNNLFRYPNIIKWTFLSLWHMCITFFVPWYIWDGYNISDDWGSLALFNASILVALVNVKVSTFNNMFCLKRSNFARNYKFIIYVFRSLLKRKNLHGY